uniref:BRCT domain-containing protein n=1 Tax=Arcella intermedia TaxID=1963864 RepID=A0A6B2KXH0_9EUKA
MRKKVDESMFSAVFENKEIQESQRMIRKYEEKADHLTNQRAALEEKRRAALEPEVNIPEETDFFPDFHYYLFGDDDESSPFGFMEEKKEKGPLEASLGLDLNKKLPDESSLSGSERGQEGNKWENYELVEKEGTDGGALSVNRKEQEKEQDSFKLENDRMDQEKLVQSNATHLQNTDNGKGGEASFGATQLENRDNGKVLREDASVGVELPDEMDCVQKQDIPTVETVNSQLSLKISELEQELSKVQEEFKALSQQNQLLITKNSKIQEDLQLLVQQNNASIQSLMAEKKSIENELRQTIEKLNQQNSLLKHEKDQVALKLVSINSDMDRCKSKFGEEVDRLRGTVKSWEDKHTEKQKSLDIVLAELRIAQENIRVLREEKEKLKQKEEQIKTLKKDSQALKEKKSEINYLEQLKGTLEREVDKLKTEVQSKEKSYHNLLKDHERMKEDFGRYKTQIEKDMDNFKTTRDSLGNSKKEVELWKKLYYDALASKGNNEAEIAKLKQEIDKMSANLDHFKSLSNEALKSKEDNEKKIGTLKGEIAKLNVNLESKQKDLEKLKNEFNKIKEDDTRKINSKQSDIDKLQAELKKIQDDKIIKEKQLNLSNEELSDAKTQLALLQKENESLKKNVEKLLKRQDKEKTTNKKRARPPAAPLDSLLDSVIKKPKLMLPPTPHSTIKKKAPTDAYVIEFSNFKDNTPYDNNRKKLLVGFVHELNWTIATYSKQLPKEVTHMVCPPKSRTLKALVALLTCKWVVAPEWVAESKNLGRAAPEVNFGLRLSQKPYEGKKFFITRNFAYEPKNSAKMDYLKMLIIEHGAASIVDDPTNADYYITQNNDNQEYGEGTPINWNEFLDLITKNIDDKYTNRYFAYQKE